MWCLGGRTFCVPCSRGARSCEFGFCRHAHVQHKHHVVLQVGGNARHVLGLGTRDLPSSGRFQPDPPEHLR